MDHNLSSNKVIETRYACPKIRAVRVILATLTWLDIVEHVFFLTHDTFLFAFEKLFILGEVGEGCVASENC